MELLHFLSSSVQIFVLTFIVGVILDSKFIQIQTQYKLTPLVAGILQLISFLLIVYTIQQYQIIYLEEYLPHTIFSTFMFTLQTNMITNFKIVFEV